ncbi:SSI family serine proteinase inhibitor [Cellulomonas endophytica]|uniref:SSI family serine proteinase inhibitor n=1 Tax=Cellulomonas endophytica TaxID=2494735 RepID=UPI001F0CD1F1|nr:SSI family serine proteinase inhibitor [Cellulomonas endophytica]
MPLVGAAVLLLVAACASGGPGAPPPSEPAGRSAAPVPSPGASDGATPTPDPSPGVPAPPTLAPPTPARPTPAPPTPAPTSPPGAAGTLLVVALDETGAGTAPRTWTLTCDPAGGDHPDPAGACAALAAAGAGALEPPPRGAVCTQQYDGPQRATVTGTVGGRAVDVTFARTDGCEIARWDALAPLLVSAGGV